MCLFVVLEMSFQLSVAMNFHRTLESSHPLEEVTPQSSVHLSRAQVQTCAVLTEAYCRGLDDK